MDLLFLNKSPAIAPQHPPKLVHGKPELSKQDAALMQTAKALEASFLAEMLGHAGMGESRDSFNGGIGEQQFSSFLRAQQATAMVEKGGIGLAEHIFHALQQRIANAN